MIRRAARADHAGKPAGHRPAGFEGTAEGAFDRRAKPHRRGSGAVGPHRMFGDVGYRTVWFTKRKRRGFSFNDRQEIIDVRAEIEKISQRID
jgi:hypothetical protein